MENPMSSRVHALAVAALLTLSAAAGVAQAQITVAEDVDTSPSGTEMAADLLVVRPLGLVATVLGTGLFILQLPLSVVQGELPREPARKLIVAPAQFTFSRPLGDFE
jgi:hypothetical protein